MEEILVVEDEKDIQNFLSLCFEQEGLPYKIVGNGRDALNYLKNKTPSLILLDIMLPGMDGFKICEEIRKTTLVPLIFVSCKNSDHDKVFGLSIGADDYIEKPFSLSVLLAKVRAHLRRNRILSKFNDAKSNIITLGNLKIDIKGRELKKDDTPIHLTSKEFELLIFLLKNKNQVLSTEQLLNSIWGHETSEIRTVIVHISSLRKKIEDNPIQPNYIITVRGVGYKLVKKE